MNKERYLAISLTTLLLMGVLMQLPASSQPSLLGASTIPLGYSDTAASGAIKAKQDLARGEVKYAVYGMPMRSYVDKLVSDGVTPLLMGCLESPRLLRRLQTLRRWSHEQEIKSFFTRGPRTRCSLGARA